MRHLTRLLRFFRNAKSCVTTTVIQVPAGHFWRTGWMGRRLKKLATAKQSPRDVSRDNVKGGLRTKGCIESEPKALRS
jgi:hypothetical protein